MSIDCKCVLDSFHLVLSSYEEIDGSWNKEQKMKELAHRDMKFIILFVHDDPKKMGGFLSFIFTNEDDTEGRSIPIIYMYITHQS